MTINEASKFSLMVFAPVFIAFLLPALFLLPEKRFSRWEWLKAIRGRCSTRRRQSRTPAWKRFQAPGQQPWNLQKLKSPTRTNHWPGVFDPSFCPCIRWTGDFSQPHSCIKNKSKGGWVCWKSFRAAPFTVLLLPYPANCRSHPKWHRVLPIKNVKNPRSKDLEASRPWRDLFNAWLTDLQRQKNVMNLTLFVSFWQVQGIPKSSKPFNIKKLPSYRLWHTKCNYNPCG